MFLAKLKIETSPKLPSGLPLQAAAVDKDVWDKEEAAKREELEETKQNVDEKARTSVLTIEKPWLCLDWRDF